jgi:Retron-type reverse transcriptase
MISKRTANFKQSFYLGAPSISLTLEKQQNAENKYTNGLFERIIDRNNLNEAFKRVKANKGSHGVDGMKVDELLQYLKENGASLRQSLLEGKYKPNPVRRVEIPKPDGKKRPLGIPTAVDRVIQQAIAQVLNPIFEVFRICILSKERRDGNKSTSKFC